MGAFLLVAFFMGVDWQVDFTRASIVGTMFYSVLTLICLGVAFVSRSVEFFPSETVIVTRRTVLGIEFQRDELDLKSVKSVTMQGVQFLKEAERPQPGLLNTRYRSFVSRRNNYFKLYLDIGERRQFIEDSTDKAELETAGATIAAFLNVPFRQEEI